MLSEMTTNITINGKGSTTEKKLEYHLVEPFVVEQKRLNAADCAAHDDTVAPASPIAPADDRQVEELEPNDDPVRSVAEDETQSKEKKEKKRSRTTGRSNARNFSPTTFSLACGQWVWQSGRHSSAAAIYTPNSRRG